MKPLETMSDMKKKLERLLLVFCEQEILSGRDVPDEVSDYLLGNLADFLLPGLGAECLQPRMEETDFLDRFEKFILAQPKDIPRAVKWHPHVYDVSKLEQAVADVTLSKSSEAQKLSEACRKIAEERIKTQNKYEDVVVSESLNMDVFDLKIELTRCKCLERLIKETPGTLKALKKLKTLIEGELSAAGKRAADLEALDVAYQALESNKDYQQLLEKYKQLLMMKRRLQLN